MQSLGIERHIHGEIGHQIQLQLHSVYSKPESEDKSMQRLTLIKCVFNVFNFIIIFMDIWLAIRNGATEWMKNTAQNSNNKQKYSVNHIINKCMYQHPPRKKKAIQMVHYL